MMISLGSLLKKKILCFSYLKINVSVYFNKQKIRLFRLHLVIVIILMFFFLASFSAEMLLKATWILWD